MLKYFTHVYTAGKCQTWHFNHFDCNEDRSKVFRQVRADVIYLWCMSARWKKSSFPFNVQWLMYICINLLLNSFISVTNNKWPNRPNEELNILENSKVQKEWSWERHWWSLVLKEEYFTLSLVFTLSTFTFY